MSSFTKIPKLVPAELTEITAEEQDKIDDLRVKSRLTPGSSSKKREATNRLSQPKK